MARSPARPPRSPALSSRRCKPLRCHASHRAERGSTAPRPAACSTARTPAERPGERRGQSVGHSVPQRRNEQVGELAGWRSRIEAAQRPAQLTQRHRVDPPDGPGEQLLRVRRGQADGDGGQHRQQRPHHRVFGQRRVHGRRRHGHTRGSQRARQARACPGHRPDDDRHLRPRHVVNKAGPAQRVGHHGGFGVRGRSKYRRNGAVRTVRAGDGARGREAGQQPPDPGHGAVQSPARSGDWSPASRSDRRCPGVRPRPPRGIRTPPDSGRPRARRHRRRRPAPAPAGRPGDPDSGRRRQAERRCGRVHRPAVPGRPRTPRAPRRRVRPHPARAQWPGAPPSRPPNATA